MSLDAIAKLLEQAIGLDRETLGRRAFASAVESRMADRDCGSIDAYLNLVRADPEERQLLIESLVVPETWFFRDIEPFKKLAAQASRPASRGPLDSPRRWRVLSLPCATGEEAYSAAIAMAQAGVPLTSIEVVGVDISRRALDVARRGCYSDRAFRGADPRGYSPYIQRTADGWCVSAEVRAAVTFVRGNALDAALFAGERPFDFVFCRNLLIYLTPEARRIVAAQLRRLVSPEGLLFLGHAEATEPPAAGFHAVVPPGAFAFARNEDLSNAAELRWVALRRAALRSIPIPARVSTSAPPLPPEDPWPEAVALADRGRLDRAARFCEQLLESQGPSAHGLCLLGVVQQARGNLTEAETCFRRALDIAPGHEESLVHWMLLCEGEGRASEAAMLRERLGSLSAKVGGGDA